MKKLFSVWKAGVLLLVLATGIFCWRASAAVETGLIAKSIKTDVVQLVSGLNAHDPVKTTACDAPDVISMKCGSTPTVGIDADREGFRAGFAHGPLWRVSLIDETVDVASSGDLAVYRGTYHEENGHEGVLMTHRTNFIAEFKRQPDKSWKIAWYSVSNMEKSHPKWSSSHLPHAGETFIPLFGRSENDRCNRRIGENGKKSGGGPPCQRQKRPSDRT